MRVCVIIVFTVINNSKVCTLIFVIFFLDFSLPPTAIPNPYYTPPLSISQLSAVATITIIIFTSMIAIDTNITTITVIIIIIFVFATRNTNIGFLSSLYFFLHHCRDCQHQQYLFSPPPFLSSCYFFSPHDNLSPYCSDCRVQNHGRVSKSIISKCQFYLDIITSFNHKSRLECKCFGIK